MSKSMSSEAKEVVAMYVTKNEKKLILKRAKKVKMSLSNYLRVRENLPTNLRGAPSQKKTESKEIVNRVFDISPEVFDESFDDNEKKNELSGEIIMNSESEKLLKENVFLRSIIGKMVEEFSGNIEKSIAHLQSSQAAFEIIKNQSRIALAEAEKMDTDADILRKKPTARLSKSQLLDKKVLEKSRKNYLESRDDKLSDDPHNILDI